MAQYFTDFGNYTTGVKPSDWTVTGDDSATDSDFIVRDEAGATGGKYVELVDNNDFDVRFLTWALAGTFQDGEILIRSRNVQAFNTNIQIAQARRDNALGDTDSGVSAQQRSQDIRINEDGNSLGSVSDKAGNNEWFWTRFSFQGTALKVRTWVSGAEPVLWDLEVTATATLTGAVGFGAANSKRQFDVDVFSVGTAGDSAPSGPVATGPETPINPSITNLLATSARLNWEQG